MLELLLPDDAGEDADALLQIGGQPHEDGGTVLRQPAPRAFGLEHQELRSGEGKYFSDQSGRAVLGMPPSRGDFAFIHPIFRAVLNEKKNLGGKVGVQVG